MNKEKAALLFPNGFINWQETHFEMVKTIVLMCEEKTPKFLCNIINEYGKAGMYDLALMWTNEFEEKYEGFEWDGLYLEKISKFVNKKVKEAEKTNQ